MRFRHDEFTTIELSPQVQEALHSQYSRRDGHRSLSKLHQGEADILYMVAEALSWPTITSLAHKYYPLYPNHKWWKRALSICNRQRIRTKTLNIVYLLRTVASVKAEALKAAFSGRDGLNRLVHPSTNKCNRDENRLAPKYGITNIGRKDQGLNPLTKRFCGAGVLT